MKTLDLDRIRAALNHFEPFIRAKFGPDAVLLHSSAPNTPVLTIEDVRALVDEVARLRRLVPSSRPDAQEDR